MPAKVMTSATFPVVWHQTGKRGENRQMKKPTLDPLKVGYLAPEKGPCRNFRRVHPRRFSLAAVSKHVRATDLRKGWP